VEVITMGRRGNEFITPNVREFVIEAFDYLTILEKCSINHSANRGLLEHIANGYVKYGNSENFIKHINEWLKSLVHIYRELGYDKNTNQIWATIDLQDQLIILDNDLQRDLQPIIDIQSKYGLLIHWRSASNKIDRTAPLSEFFEYVEAHYPAIKDRYKGLGSSDAKVSKEVIMDPKTRRIVRVSMDDPDTIRRLGVLVGKSKDEVDGRKELLFNFKFSEDMIDN
jgi:DNA gyrase/topoisomerase IV subunit B